jgi:uncharacterized protein (TIGR02246 family)
LYYRPGECRGAAVVSAPAGASRTDEQAILEVISHWDQGWKDFNAELAARDYSTDADWTNAFGLRRKGKAEIFEFLSKIYRSPTMRPRKSTPSKTTLRFLNGDAAVASSYRETVGQKTHSGSEYPMRKTHDLRVLVRSGGRWLIVSHLIMDEKDVRP